MKSHEAEAVEHCKERMQIQQDKALLNVEKENQKTIQSLKTKYQSEIDKYQQKYYEILERFTFNASSAHSGTNSGIY